MRSDDLEIKYSLDENQEKYYSATHKSAVQGIDLNDIENKTNKTEKDLDNLKSDFKRYQDAYDTLIGDTGWIDFQLLPSINKNKIFGKDGFKCGVREIRIQNVRIKSIRINAQDVPHNTQIGAFPIGFIKENHYFYGATDGNSNPIRVELKKTGEIIVYTHENDRNKSDIIKYIYQEFTWLE